MRAHSGDGGCDVSMLHSGDDLDQDMDGEGMSSKNRRHRTLRQQMLNKQAQQRYRCANLDIATQLARCIPSACTNKVHRSYRGSKQNSSEPPLRLTKPLWHVLPLPWRWWWMFRASFTISWHARSAIFQNHVPSRVRELCT